ncbi:hypothetical protein [Saccharopolyspora sp. NPDC002376]
MEHLSTALSRSWSSLITDWTRALKADGIYTSAARKVGTYLDKTGTLP